MDEKSDALCTTEAPAETEAVESAGSAAGDADFSANSCSELTATALDALISEATAEDPPTSEIVSGTETSATTDTLATTETPVTSDTLTVPTEESSIISMSEATASPQEGTEDTSQDSIQHNIEENSQEALTQSIQENSEDKPEEDAQENSQDNFHANIEENSQENVANSVVSEENKPAEETGDSNNAEHVRETQDDVKPDEDMPLCDLEEELKRLHGGEDEAKEVNENDVGPKDALEGVGLIEKKQLEGNQTMTSAQQRTMDRTASKPITRTSDLEDMLSADDVLKDYDVIQKSQKDLLEMDLLVCGKCHDVFHIVQDFQQHKTQNCSPSNVANICETETKPQVWGFTLWKNKQQNVAKKKGEVLPSSWAVYQKWCQLPEKDKNSWIAAGQTLQYFNKVGTAKVSEVRKTKDAKDPLALDGLDSNKENSVYAASKTTVQPTKTVRVNREIAIMPKNNENSNKALRTVRSTETREYAVEKIVAKRFNPKRKTWEYQVKWEHFPSEDNTWEPVGNLHHCKQMVELFEEQLKKQKLEKAKQQQQQLNIAKMKGKQSFTSPGTSKLGSPGMRPQRTSKQKALDQVKQWCGNISDEDDTSRGTKRQLEDADSDDSFEKKMKWDELSDDSGDDFKPQKDTTKKVQQVTPKTQHQIQIIKNGVGKGTPLPQNILIPDANGVVRINQKQLPALSTGVYIMSKTAGIIKLDSSTSKVATSGGQTVVKVAPKIGQTQIKIVKKEGPTGGQQIIQVPMQKVTPGQRTPQKAALGQKVVPTKTTPPVKVYKPIITKVKRVESGGVKLGETLPAKKPNTEVMKKTPDMKKAIEVATKIVAKSKEAEPAKKATEQSGGGLQDESDDGLEELPFPDEIKIPEPDSPPGDFVLDPITGKIAGVEYPPAPDPEPLPEPEPMEEERATDTLDNIVKLAAADITEEDLKSETPMDIEEPTIQQPVEEEPHYEEQESEEEVRKQQQTPLIIRRGDVVGTPSPGTVTHHRTLVRTSSGSTIRRQSSGGQQAQGASILNRALTTSPPKQQRTIFQVGPGGTQQRIVQQRVVQHVVPRTTVLNPIVRPAAGAHHQQTYTRTRPQAPKPRVQQTQQVHRVVRSHPQIVQQSQPQIVQQSPTQKVYYTTKVVQQQPPTMTRRIGSTTIRSTPLVNSSPIGGAGGKQPVRVVQTPSGHRYVQRKEPMVVRSAEKKVMQQKVHHKPRTIISMPSLSGDEDTIPQQEQKNVGGRVVSQQETALHQAVASAMEQESLEAAALADAEAAAKQQGAADGAASQQATLTAGELGTFTLADSDNPIFITGDDGTVYQVAGQNEHGQTILLTQGADGQQQCLLVTNELADSDVAAAASATTSEEDVQAQQQQQLQQQQQAEQHEEQQQAAEQQAEQHQQQQMSMPDVGGTTTTDVTEPLSINTGHEGVIGEDTAEGDADGNDQVVAQVVRTEPPSPGGTHKVVVMLPDGNLMMTQVSPEEYASLELE
ncbi:unnamed protein product [Acanthoscelides obtectus]|uniref:Chromo domain-containing protein n=1 Tax=Acanthoscelides obtectus TaxID=200917 RepID=A0A9P0K0K9_ACAOB|nr:unnamed protein product [Acanthoscelides obtectus]CAK1621307.1 Chromodomain Y-like protein 2 [Acanthoscelides obtectus]